jgi:hypothetical protein
MPTVRKVSADEVAAWNDMTAGRSHKAAAPVAQPALPASERDHLLRALADRSGLSRIDHRHTHGWLARVYPGRAITLSRHFSDGRYGGPASALAAAAAWRDATRKAVPHTPRLPSQPRILRIERWWQAGYYAYRSRRERRYFSDAAHGGTDGSARVARQWAGIDKLGA